MRNNVVALIGLVAVTWAAGAAGQSNQASQQPHDPLAAVRAVLAAMRPGQFAGGLVSVEADRYYTDRGGILHAVRQSGMAAGFLGVAAAIGRGGKPAIIWQSVLPGIRLHEIEKAWGPATRTEAANLTDPDRGVAAPAREGVWHWFGGIGVGVIEGQARWVAMDCLALPKPPADAAETSAPGRVVFGPRPPIGMGAQRSRTGPPAPRAPGEVPTSSQLTNLFRGFRTSGELIFDVPPVHWDSERKRYVVELGANETIDRTKLQAVIDAMPGAVLADGTPEYREHLAQCAAEVHDRARGLGNDRPHSPELAFLRARCFADTAQYVRGFGRPWVLSLLVMPDTPMMSSEPSSASDMTRALGLPDRIDENGIGLSVRYWWGPLTIHWTRQDGRDFIHCIGIDCAMLGDGGFPLARAGEERLVRPGARAFGGK